jgi:quercetin dioxygenase-like cupin family protein
MTFRTRLLIALAVVFSGIVGIAVATPIVGLKFANILAFGTSNTEIAERARVALPEVNSSTGEEQEDEWSAKFITTGPSNFIVQDASYNPGGHTGWHSHPGILLISVTEGSLEWYDSQCLKHVYNAGDTITENTSVHYFRNVGTVNVRVMVTYVIAKGQPRRIDQPAPACAAALGLD